MAVRTKSISTGATVAGTLGKVAWEQAPTELSRDTVFMQIYGDTGTGRTSLALSAPGPIAMIHYAEKLEGVIQKFSSEKDIRVFDFGHAIDPGDRVEISAQAMESWRSLLAAWLDAESWAKTIVLDTDTEAWELIRLAYFGGLKPDGGRIDANYGPVNGAWRSLFKRHRYQDKYNLITIGQTKDEYKTKGGNAMGQRTGRTIRVGQKEIAFMADVGVRTEKTIYDDRGLVFSSYVEKGWWNSFSEGMEFEDEDSNFASIMGIVTESGPEKWLK